MRDIDECEIVVVFIIGIVYIIAGAALIHPGAGLIIAGLLLCLYAYVSDD